MIDAEQLAAARDRNRRRLRGEIVNGFVLRANEVKRLVAHGGVRVKRQIHPAIVRWRWSCPYGVEGKTYLVKEPVKYFGTKSNSALYMYSDDPRWREFDWPLLAPDDMPSKAVRFVMTLENAHRVPDAWLWLLSFTTLRRTE